MQVPNPAGAKAFLSQRFERGDSTIFVAAEEGKLIGFVQLYPLLDSLKLGNLWLLNDLCAPPAAEPLFTTPGLSFTVCCTCVAVLRLQKSHERHHCPGSILLGDALPSLMLVPQ